MWVIYKYHIKIFNAYQIQESTPQKKVLRRIFQINLSLPKQNNWDECQGHLAEWSKAPV